MDTETAKAWIDVLKYALDTLWPYAVGLGLVAPFASKRIRGASMDRIEDTLKPKPKNQL